MHKERRKVGWFYKKYALPFSSKMEKGRAITSYNFSSNLWFFFLCVVPLMVMVGLFYLYK